MWHTHFLTLSSGKTDRTPIAQQPHCPAAVQCKQLRHTAHQHFPSIDTSRENSTANIQCPPAATTGDRHVSVTHKLLLSTHPTRCAPFLGSPPTSSALPEHLQANWLAAHYPNAWTKAGSERCCHGLSLSSAGHQIISVCEKTSS
jgi:hypothetical protein